MRVEQRAPHAHCGRREQALARQARWPRRRDWSRPRSLRAAAATGLAKSPSNAKPANAESGNPGLACATSGRAMPNVAVCGTPSTLNSTPLIPAGSSAQPRDRDPRAGHGLDVGSVDEADGRRCSGGRTARRQGRRRDNRRRGNHRVRRNPQMLVERVDPPAASTAPRLPRRRRMRASPCRPRECVGASRTTGPDRATSARDASRGATTCRRSCIRRRPGRASAARIPRIPRRTCAA